MAACYAEDATFSDPVFVGLRDDEPGTCGGCWRAVPDMTVELVAHDADGDTGTAHWVARYTFGQTGRPIVNDVARCSCFDDAGLIVEQHDDFDFWRWARQALGPAGSVAGWTPVLQHSVRDKRPGRPRGVPRPLSQ